MQLHLLLTYNLRPLPESISIIHSFGSLLVVDQASPDSITGEHCILEGQVDAVRLWLSEKAVDFIWVGNGVPMMEQFDKLHWVGDVNDKDSGLRPIKAPPKVKPQSFIPPTKPAEPKVIAYQRRPKKTRTTVRLKSCRRKKTNHGH